MQLQRATVIAVSFAAASIATGCEAPSGPSWAPQAYALVSAFGASEYAVGTDRFAESLVSDTIVLLPDGTGFARRRYGIVNLSTLASSVRHEETGLRYEVAAGQVAITWLPVCAGWCMTFTTQIFEVEHGALVTVGRMGPTRYRSIRALAP